MALSLVTNNQFNPPITGLNGVYQGQQQPVLLGLQGLTLKLDAFYIGFDPRLKPAMVRIFLDPTLINPPDANPRVLGLMQMGQITYQGAPITPATYGMGLEYLENYVAPPSDELSANRYWWADMLDATRARQANLTTPMFEWNGYLRNPSYQITDFLQYPKPNGVITSLPPPVDPAPNDALCASLVDAIDLDLDSAPEAAILRYLNKLIERKVNPAKSGIYTREQVTTGSALEFALNLLEVTDMTTVEGVEVIGPFILITMVDIEAEGPLFIAFYNATQQTPTTETLVVYELNMDEFEELRFAALTTTFNNIRDSLIVDGILLDEGFPEGHPSSAGGRGGSGLNPFPFFFTGYSTENEDETNGPEIAFNYKTLALSFTQDGQFFCHGGIKWQVSRIFNPATLEFGPLRFVKPTLCTIPDIFRFNFAFNGFRPETSQLFRVFKQFQTSASTPPSALSSSPAFFENVTDTTTTSQGFGDWSRDWTNS
jgi:hypothetical protein